MPCMPLSTSLSTTPACVHDTHRCTQPMHAYSQAGTDSATVSDTHVEARAAAAAKGDGCCVLPSASLMRSATGMRGCSAPAWACTSSLRHQQNTGYPIVDNVKASYKGFKHNQAQNDFVNSRACHWHRMQHEPASSPPACLHLAPTLQTCLGSKPYQQAPVDA
jgi:hypothetical protein